MPVEGIGSNPAVDGAPAAANRTLHVTSIGTISYADGLALQDELVQLRRADEIPDQLLLLQHPHVITLGTSARTDHVLVDDTQRKLLGIEMFETGRGGDVTYHGPGQLVGYPILDLKPDRCDLHQYVRDIEEALIRALARFGLAGDRQEGLTGVWLRDKKIAAIGVRVSSGWITSHGFALNVNTNLSFFDAIVPCGIRQYGVTSMKLQLDREIDITQVEKQVAREFASVFGRDLDLGKAANIIRKT